LMFEWLTLWPTIGPIPVSSQRRDMGLPWLGEAGASQT
jgi:hypothetical protein